MTHPLTPREQYEQAKRDFNNLRDDGTIAPREKVAGIVSGAEVRVEYDSVGRQYTFVRDAVGTADAILTALASGSGDHAELEGAAKRLADIELSDGGCGYCDAVMDVYGHQPSRQFYRDLKALLAENAALRAANTEAERKLAEAVATLKEIAEIEPKPFDGGLDMEAIRACDECQRYAGHPVQQGICNTHRRPLWDREKHESHEEKALGYRAKSIARTFLSKEAERG